MAERFRAWKRVDSKDDWYRAFQTILKMLRSRGYDISEYEHLLARDYDEYVTKIKLYNHSGDITIPSLVDGAPGAKVYFIPRMSLPETNAYIAALARMCARSETREQFDTTIIVLPGAPTDSGAYKKESLPTMGTPYRIELFYAHYILTDPTEHALYVEHTILNSEEADKFREETKRFAGIPKLPAEDAIAKYMGSRSGDVTRIKRSNEDPAEIASASYYYRGVN